MCQVGRHWWTDGERYRSWKGKCLNKDAQHSMTANRTLLSKRFGQHPWMRYAAQGQGR
jgi:hypothetical protein